MESRQRVEAARVLSGGEIRVGASIEGIKE
jgi:hypothetical protein